MSACGASRVMVTRSRRGSDAHCHEAANASWAMDGRTSHAARRNRARPAGVFRITGFASKNRAMLKVCHLPERRPGISSYLLPVCLTEPSRVSRNGAGFHRECLIPLPRGTCRAVIVRCIVGCPPCLRRLHAWGVPFMSLLRSRGGTGAGILSGPVQVPDNQASGRFFLSFSMRVVRLMPSISAA